MSSNEGYIAIEKQLTHQREPMQTPHIAQTDAQTEKHLRDRLNINEQAGLHGRTRDPEWDCPCGLQK